ncbi:MAG: 4Fe-4S binding protein [Bacteroidales bacterium]|nr:4Fe-4S binding protein [Bacteroidales bacterium]MBN2634159.1 4Fe-4S binding protein [Bacteroidales bacterium]
MSKSILIDLMKLRTIMAEDPSLELPEALYYPTPNQNGLKTIRELAVFRFTCRKCEDAPCIAACPADALEKDSEGIINRHTNLCVSCKSCVTICPFGTMMTDFFSHHRNKDLFYDLDSTEEMEKFAAACPPGTVTITDSRESPGENIFRLNNKVLVKDLLYKTD